MTHSFPKRRSADLSGKNNCCARKMEILRADRISKSFAGVKVLDDVSLGIAAGTVHALTGENGAGKSTLMNILMGLFPPDEGTIFLHGRETDRKSVVKGTSVSVGVDLGGRRIIKKHKHN